MQFAVRVMEAIEVEDSESGLRLLEAFANVSREDFIEKAFAPRAFQDISLPIGFGQTISKPTTVANMLAKLRPQPGERVLEVGVGCGYVTALLAAQQLEVYGIEKIAPLAQATRKRLDALGLYRVLIRSGDGKRGWPEQAPFDAILVSCCLFETPQMLLDQLAPGGRLVAPVQLEQDSDESNQRIYRWRSVGGQITAEARRFVVEDLGPCHFVPVT